MQEWEIYDGDNPYDYLEKNIDKIKIGDAIKISYDNQLGYKRYEVISDENGKKDLKLIADLRNEEQEGGKKRRRSKSKRTRRRKGRKSRKSRKSKRY